MIVKPAYPEIYIEIHGQDKAGYALIWYIRKCGRQLLNVCLVVIKLDGLAAASDIQDNIGSSNKTAAAAPDHVVKEQLTSAIEMISALGYNVYIIVY